MLELSDKGRFRAEMAKHIRNLLLQSSILEKAKNFGEMALRVLKSFTMKIDGGPTFKLDIEPRSGFADSGDLTSDLIDLFVSVGEAAQRAGVPVCVLVDEVQNATEDDLNAFISAIHRVVQLGLPLTTVWAGLPQILRRSGDANGYAERLFRFLAIENLDNDAGRTALLNPAAAMGVTYEDSASAFILRETGGYPYFLQEYGRFAWEVAEKNIITNQDARKAAMLAVDALDKSFFRVRVDRTTNAEKKFLASMAWIGAGPYQIGDVAASMNRKTDSLNTIRASLIEKGLIFAPSIGLVAFTVPHFDTFGRRHWRQGREGAKQAFYE